MPGLTWTSRSPRGPRWSLLSWGSPFSSSTFVARQQRQPDGHILPPLPCRGKHYSQFSLQQDWYSWCGVLATSYLSSREVPEVLGVPGSPVVPPPHSNLRHTQELNHPIRAQTWCPHTHTRRLFQLNTPAHYLPTGPVTPMSPMVPFCPGGLAGPSAPCQQQQQEYLSVSLASPADV